MNIIELENSINTQAQEIQRMHLESTQKEELVFFSKQKISLNESLINEMKKESSENNLIISRNEA